MDNKTKVKSKNEVDLKPKGVRVYLCSVASKWKSHLISALKYYNVDYFDPSDHPNQPGLEMRIKDEFENKSDIHLYIVDKDTKSPYELSLYIKSCMMTSEYYDDLPSVHVSTRFLRNGGRLANVIMLMDTSDMDETTELQFDAYRVLGCEVMDNGGDSLLSMSSNDYDNIKSSISSLAEYLSSIRIQIVSPSDIDGE